MSWFDGEVVIDFRSRPTTPECLRYLDTPQVRRVMEILGTSAPAPTDLSGYLEYLSQAGVDRVGFFGHVAQDTNDWDISNERVAELAAQSGGRIFTFAGVSCRGGMAAVRYVEHAIRGLGFAGISLEPFGDRTTADDRVLYPIYAKACELGVPVAITAGPLPYAGLGPVEGPALWSAEPIAIDRVATDFPELTIIYSHTSWPWSNAVIAVALRHPHVYFDTELYYGLPGNEVLGPAIDRLVPERALFSSGYPIVPIEKARKEIESSGIQPKHLAGVFGGNARRLLEVTQAAR